MGLGKLLSLIKYPPGQLASHSYSAPTRETIDISDGDHLRAGKDFSFSFKLGVTTTLDDSSESDAAEIGVTGIDML